ncbi:MAG: cell division protein FtsL [Deltaproteobacteria bacterium]|nr:cell division protein FtsL [Deltaproteobacteria bacterium]MBW1795718.1 cell division protein FtsL [Deltaproteobacteria bacterium]
MKKGRRHPMIAIWVAIMVVLMAQLLVYTWCRVQYVQTGYEITEATQEHQRLMDLHRKLQVEEARLRSPERIMRIGRQRGLVMPGSKQVVVIP